MKPTAKRRLDVFLLGGAAVVAGVAAALGALFGDTERIGDYWMHASLGAGDAVDVVEVIDYDFGFYQRHGILRDIPDVDRSAAITVYSPSAPDQVVTNDIYFGVRLKVGDPDITISNRHRYRIDYPIDGLIDRDHFAWDAVGLDWDIPINNAAIHVTSDRAFAGIECHSGSSGSRGGCDVEEIAPGHLFVSVSGLGSGEAVTIEADLGEPLDAPVASPPVPDGLPHDPGSGWLSPGLAALVAALLSGGVVSRLIRRLGREQVYMGGPTDAAFGTPEGAAGFDLVDHEQLADMAGIEFSSPRGLSATAGGIIHDEQVKSEHQMAWLIECAIRDEIVFETDDGDFAIVRGSAEAHAAVAERLESIFRRGKERIELGTYNSSFAASWAGLHKELEKWRLDSGLWDPKGRERKKRAGRWGSLAGLLGYGVTALGAVFAGRAGEVWLPLVVVGALVAGAGMAALTRAWELPVRTPAGSAHWLQIESFRRFIASSEARHAEAAAQAGLLRHYTAWAMALGELDHWKDSVEAAAKMPGTIVNDSVADYSMVAMAGGLSKATRQTFTAPSSSGSSGGGGGAGGGGGGGGGGSW